MFDCLKHWVREYHVDGFYLMGDAPMNRSLQEIPCSGTKLLSSWFDTENFTEEKKHLFSGIWLTTMSVVVEYHHFLKGDEDQLPSYPQSTEKF